MIVAVITIGSFIYFLWTLFIRNIFAGRITGANKAVIITGCDTGFGFDLSLRLDKLQFTVFSGCLNPDGDGARQLRALASSRLHVIPFDVRSDSEIEKVHLYVKEYLPSGGLWAIVSNAGFNVMGDVELLTVPLYDKAFNVNFLGAVRTIRRFLYLVRSCQGRVVVVSSVRGRIPWPGDSPYHVTKHALETMADSLRLEMNKFGVRVSVVEPGNFSTATACQNDLVFQRYAEEANQMWESASEEVRACYGRAYLNAMLAKQRAGVVVRSSNTTKPVTDAIEDALLSTIPHTRYIVPGCWFDHNAVLARIYPVLPTWLSDKIIEIRTKCNRLSDCK